MKLTGNKKKLWTLVSEYVRRKDADFRGYSVCYTCGASQHWKEMNAGHAIGGHSNAVMFDLEILRCQCVKCNMPPNSGCYYEFGKKLNQENGEGWYEQKKIDSEKPIKLNKAFYESMIDEMQQKLSKLN